MFNCLVYLNFLMKQRVYINEYLTVANSLMNGPVNQQSANLCSFHILSMGNIFVGFVLSRFSGICFTDGACSTIPSWQRSAIMFLDSGRLEAIFLGIYVGIYIYFASLCHHHRSRWVLGDAPTKVKDDTILTEIQHMNSNRDLNLLHTVKSLTMRARIW